MEKKACVIILAVIVSAIAVSFTLIRSNPDIFISCQVSTNSLTASQSDSIIQHSISDTSSFHNIGYSRSGQKEK